MDNQQDKAAPATEPEIAAGKAKPGRFWQVFWLSFLVLSVGYAWYSFYAPSNDIAWAEDFTSAQEQASESDKPIILFFTGKWCSPCQIMKRQVWADEQVKDTVNSTFISVTIDVDNPNSAATLMRYGIGATPTTIITDSGGNVLHQANGGLSKAQFLALVGNLDPTATEGPQG